MSVPDLRFPEFEGEWEEKSLGNISQIKKSKYNPENDKINFKCIELEHISQNTGQILGFCESKDQNSIKNRFEKGDVLFGKLRPYLKKYWLAKFDGVCSSEIWVFEGIEVSNKFFFNLIQTDKFNYIANISSGSKMPRSDWRYMRNVNFKIPSIEEQEKIEKLEKKQVLWESYKKGMMQKIFSQELRFKDENGEDYPDWEVKKINELFEFLPTNSLSRANLNYDVGEVKNIHYGDIHTKFPTILDCEKIEIPFVNLNVDLNKIKPESYCKNGDLVIADASEDYNDIGKAIELKNVDDKMLLAGLHTFLARDKSGITVEGYRGYMFLNEDIRLQIKKIATGISVLGISKTNLGELKINIPSISEQVNIASFLSDIDFKIKKLKKEVEISSQFKKGLLQKLFC